MGPRRGRDRDPQVENGRSIVYLLSRLVVKGQLYPLLQHIAFTEHNHHRCKITTVLAKHRLQSQALPSDSIPVLFMKPSLSLAGG